MDLKPIQVIIVDDHPVVCSALRQYLTSCHDINVAGTAAACDKGLELAKATRPSVAIVDLHLPLSGRDNPTPSLISHGIHLISVLHRQLPRMGILALTGLFTSVTHQAALQVGAHICLSKNCESSEIAGAVRVVSRGEMSERYSLDPALIQSLTVRELEILHLISLGLTNQEIADQLDISRHTASNHLKNIYSKTGLSRRVEVASLAAF